MVRITIFAEGGPNDDRPAVQTAADTAVFREGFSNLFSSLKTPYEVVIEPIGSISRAKKYLREIDAGKLDGLVLIDLDGPPSQKSQRIADNYSDVGTDNLYFMVQEMEAWILSQPTSLEVLGEREGWRRQSPEAALADDTLLRAKAPEDIANPSRVLATLLKRYFDQDQKRGGTWRRKAVTYHKMQHGSRLIALLDLSRLRETFEDVANLSSRLSPMDM